jgi:PQQ-like domain
MIQRTLLLISLVLCPLSSALAEDWPQWRGPDRTGVSKETGLLQSWPPNGPKLLWTFRDAGVGHSSMAVVGDRLYSMGSDWDGKIDAQGYAVGGKDYVYAIDLKTQKKLWSTEVGAVFADSVSGSGPRSTPMVDGNFLYAIGGHGDLVCMETATGKKVWSQGLKTNLDGTSPGYGYCESPLVDGDLVIATPGGKKGALAAFDKKTGKLKWRSIPSDTDMATYSSMIAIDMGGVRQYVQVAYPESLTSFTSFVFGVRASDGKLLWKSPPAGNKNSGISTPIYHNECVYFSAPAGCSLVKLISERNKFKIELIYTNTNRKTGLCNYHGGVVLVGDYLYGHSETVGLICQNFKTGKAAWVQKGVGGGSLTFADGNLYYYQENSEMLLVKATPAGCKEQGRFRVAGGGGWTCPVVANGKLYLRNQNLIFCYDVHKPR